MLLQARLVCTGGLTSTPCFRLSLGCPCAPLAEQRPSLSLLPAPGPRGRRGDMASGVVLMHRDDLKRVAPLWLHYSEARAGPGRAVRAEAPAGASTQR